MFLWLTVKRILKLGVSTSQLLISAKAKKQNI